MKSVLLLHGWPTYINKSHPAYILFKKKGYKIDKPVLFDDFYYENLLSKLDDNYDVILGFSLSGVLCQQLALLYPKAKLILVGTGPKFMPRWSTAARIMIITRISDLLFLAAKYLPLKITYFFYGLISPYLMTTKPSYRKTMKSNLIAMKKIKLSVYRQVMEFLLKINTKKILPKIKNKTLIISGTKDIAMPLRLGKKLRKIPNSTFYKVKGTHHELFNDETIKIIENFIQ